MVIHTKSECVCLFCISSCVVFDLIGLCSLFAVDSVFGLVCLFSFAFVLKPRGEELLIYYRVFEERTLTDLIMGTGIGEAGDMKKGERE